MKEILFKGRRKDNGEWVEGYYCKCPANDGTTIDSILNIIDGSFIQFPVISETVGQYIELITVDGTKIFEDDIAEFDDELFVVKRECDTPGGCWAETGHFLKAINRESGMAFEDTIDEWSNEICVKIVGNIHDNPELLKGE